MKDPERANAERIETLEFWLQQLHDRIQRLVGGDANVAWLQKCAARPDLFEQRLELLKRTIDEIDALAAFPE